jgi:hypothetical protein
MDIFVRTTGTKCFHVQPSDLIWSLKYRLKQLTRIPITEQVLIWRGRLLDSKETFANIKPYDVIYFASKTEGGICVPAAVPMITNDPANLAVNITNQVGERADETKNFIQRIGEFVIDKLKMGKEQADRIRAFTMKTTHFTALMARWVNTYRRVMMMIARFYPIIMVALIILAFFGKPLEFIILFISAIVVSILYVIVFIFKYPPLSVVAYFLYNIVVYFMPMLAYCVIFTTIFLVMTLVCGLIALFNAKGLISNVYMCQNGPEAWFKIPSYHLGNKYSRGFFCSRPCLPGYEPDGSMCRKIYKHQPSYCPPAEIMRIYTGFKKRDRKPYFKDLDKLSLKYLSQNEAGRKKMLEDHFIKKQQFLALCKEPMNPYKDMTLNMCANLDIMEKNKTMSPALVKKMRHVCYQQYCNTLSTYPFCTVKTSSNETDGSALVKQIIKIIAIIMIFFVIVIFAVKILYDKGFMDKAVRSTS